MIFKRGRMAGDGDGEDGAVKENQWEQLQNDKRP